MSYGIHLLFWEVLALQVFALLALLSWWIAHTPNTTRGERIAVQFMMVFIILFLFTVGFILLTVMTMWWKAIQ